MKKLLIVLAIMLLPAMLFAAGSSSTSGNYIRFAWWGNPTRDERTNAVIAIFEARTGATVEAETVGWGDYWPRINTLAAAGDLPDVMQHDTSVILQHANAGLLEDLNPFVQRRIIDLTNWPAAGLGAGTFNNRLYGLVLGTNAWGIGADAAVLQRAGVTINDASWTWQDFERIATQIHQRTGVQTMGPYEYRQALEHIGRQFGAPLFTADERALGIAGNQQAIAAFAEWFNMWNRLNAAGVLYNVDDSFVAGRPMAEAPLGQGRVWNSDHWSNQHPAHQNSVGRQLVYLMFPTVTAPPRAPFGLYMRASMYISMTTHSNNKDLAAQFINFFINDIEGNRILMADRGVPIPTNVRQDLSTRVDADNRYIFDYITKITPFSSPSDPPAPGRAIEVEDAHRVIIHRALNARTAGATVVNQLIQEAAAILTRP